MKHELHPKARDWMIGAGKPPVTAEERARARELRDKNMTLEQIGQVMGRVKSTVYNMLRERSA